MTEVEPEELNRSHPDSRVNGELFAPPLQRASGTVLVEMVQLPTGPFSISMSDTNNNKCEKFSNHPAHSSSNGQIQPAMNVSSSMSSISSSSLPPYSELVKELGAL